MTDPRGAFSIEGLAPDGRYALVVGGRGLLSRGDYSGITPESGEVRVVVGVLFGAAARIRERGGTPLRVSEWLGAYPRSATACEWSENQTSMSHRDPAVILAGVDPQAVESQGPHVMSWFFIGESPDARIGPIECEIREPGYRETSVRLEVAAVTDGLLVHDVELDVQGGGFGSVDVEFRGVVGHPGRLANRESRVGNIAFYGAQGEPLFVRGVYELPRSRVRWTGIPRGTYGIRFVSLDGFFEYPGSPAAPLEVTVGESAASIVIEGGDLGELECLFEDDQGIRFTGPAAISLERLDAYVPSRVHDLQLQNAHLFRSAPYLIEGLPAGAYRITPVLGRWRPVRLAPRETTVEAGARTVVEIDL